MSRKIVKVFTVMVICFGLSGIFSGNVFADGADWKTIKSKAALEGIYNCFKAGAYSSDWETVEGVKGFIVDTVDEEAVKLPYNKTDAFDNNTNCRQIIVGFDENVSDNDERLNEGFINEEVFITSNSKSIAQVFAGDKLDGVGGLGYKAEAMSSVKSLKIGVEPPASSCSLDERRSLQIGLLSDEKPYSSSLAPPEGEGVTWKSLSDNSLVFPKATIVNGGYVFDPSDDNEVNVPRPGSNDEYWYKSYCGDTYIATLSVGPAGDNGMYNIRATGSSTIVEVPAGLKNNETLDSDGMPVWFTVGAETIQDYNSQISGANYRLKMDLSDRRKKLEAARTFLKGMNERGNSIGYYVDGLIGHDSLKFTDQEAYDLYAYYITDVLGYTVICDDSEQYSLIKDGNNPDIDWSNEHKCKLHYDNADIDVNGRVPTMEPLYGLDKNNYFNSRIETLRDILDKLGNLKLEELDTGGSANVIGGSDLSEASCMNSNAAGSLGWIMCPVLDLLSGAADAVYSDYVEPALKIEPEIFNNGGENSATRQAWSIFQGMANVLFIILLLVVIFSQITGVGIDNYGIKKILPKLIIAAILINLSYFLCILAIDLSNIAGNGLFALLDSIGVQAPETVGGIAYYVKATASTVFWPATILGALTAGVWPMIIAGGGPAIVVTLFIGALSVVISIFFVFLTFAARRSAIVILTVISPLAFACFILPNTKKLFDKWWKILWALLVLYPVCGLLIGGGNLVSKILLTTVGTSGGLFAAITAMAAGIVPIFFIPTLLRGSLSLLGGIGAKISGFGSKYGGKLTGSVDKSIRGSEGFKLSTAEYQRRRQSRGYERTIGRLERIKGRRALTTAETRRLARSTEGLEKMEREERAAGAILASKEFSGETQASLEETLSKAIDNGDVDRVESLSKALVSKYGPGGAKSIGDILSEKSMKNSDGSDNEKMKSVMARYKDMIEHDSDFSKQMRGKASDAFAMMSGGGLMYKYVKNADGSYALDTNGKRIYERDANGRIMTEVHDLKDFAAENPISTTDADWASQGSSTLRRAIQSGKLDADRIKELLNSKDQSVQTMLSDEGKRKVLQAAAYNAELRANGQLELSESDAAAAFKRRAEQEANAPTIRSVGTYRPRASHGRRGNSGPVVKIYEMSDGTFIDAVTNTEVDITKYESA